MGAGARVAHVTHVRCLAQRRSARRANASLPQWQQGLF